eukprot:TRINITY_DN6244_c0_g1_i1.p1 TRINITY_DN6244_c0_g1~~TRINITY_DN6244_c0_g1_i1.p1  ORF type:complete len:323 (-),score=48.99 TRINITY_DN6244_c0_g1_i1:21-899(-)
MSEKQKTIALIRPIDSTISTSADGHNLSPMTRSSRRVTFLQQDKNTYSLDLSFNPVIEQKIASSTALSDLLSNSDRYQICLMSELDINYVVTVYITVSPYDIKHTYLLGTLTSSKPYLPLPYPLPHVGSVTTARLGALVIPQIDLKKYTSPKYVANPYIESNPDPTVNVLAVKSPVKQPPKKEEQTLLGGVEVLICNGETHTFKVAEKDTFKDLLERSARRWHVNVNSYELQDEEFASCDPNNQVLPHLQGKERRVLKFVPTQTMEVAKNWQQFQHQPVFGAPPAGLPFNFK